MLCWKLFTCFISASGIPSKDNVQNQILSKLASVEVLLRNQALMLQQVLGAVNQDPAGSTCELPDGVVLPLQTLNELYLLEKMIESTSSAKQVVIYTLFLTSEVVIIH